MAGTFFGLHVPQGSLGGVFLVLCLSVLLGGLVGFEREIHGHPAGLRTHILVCLGSALITAVSVSVATMTTQRADPGRISAQIVSGIGFLGAGAIIRDGASVRGLTTAASIWTTAGIGIALGTSPFYAEVAVIATTVVLFTLWLLNPIEDWFSRKARRPWLLQVRLAAGSEGKLLERLCEQGVTLEAIQFAAAPDGHERQVTCRVRLPEKLSREALLADVGRERGVNSVTIE